MPTEPPEPETRRSMADLDPEAFLARGLVVRAVGEAAEGNS